MRYINNLKALQQARGLTIGQAAEAMGMSRGGYLKVQRGENRLTSTTIAKAAQAFGVAQSEIVTSIETCWVDSVRAASQHGGTIPAGGVSLVAPEYVTVLEEDGTTTLPPELRAEWGLKPGDKVEFFQDHAGGWQLRPRNAGPLDFLAFLSPRAKRPDARSDDEALSRAMSERNLPLGAARSAR
jgi:transcriptional regulator with XRE-family HTH domain